MKVALFACAGVQPCIDICVGARMCEPVAAGCVGIATLVYSSVMGHYSSCIVHEVVPEFQTDPQHLPQYTRLNFVPQVQIWTAAIHTWII